MLTEAELSLTSLSNGDDAESGKDQSKNVLKDQTTHVETFGKCNTDNRWEM